MSGVPPPLLPAQAANPILPAISNDPSAAAAAASQPTPPQQGNAIPIAALSPALAALPAASIVNAQLVKFISAGGQSGLLAELITSLGPALVRLPPALPLGSLLQISVGTSGPEPQWRLLAIDGRAQPTIETAALPQAPILEGTRQAPVSALTPQDQVSPGALPSANSADPLRTAGAADPAPTRVEANAAADNPLKSQAASSLQAVIVAASRADMPVGGLIPVRISAILPPAASATLSSVPATANLASAAIRTPDPAGFNQPVLAQTQTNPPEAARAQTDPPAAVQTQTTPSVSAQVQAIAPQVAQVETNAPLAAEAPTSPPASAQNEANHQLAASLESQHSVSSQPSLNSPIEPQIAADAAAPTDNEPLLPPPPSPPSGPSETAATLRTDPAPPQPPTAEIVPLAIPEAQPIETPAPPAGATFAAPTESGRPDARPVAAPLVPSSPPSASPLIIAPQMSAVPTQTGPDSLPSSNFPLSITGEILSNQLDGRPLLQTPIGLLALPLPAAALPPGSHLTLQINGPVALPAPLEDPLSIAPDKLAVDHLASLLSDAARVDARLGEALAAGIPAPGPHLAGQLLAFSRAVAENSFGAWAGPTLAGSLAHALPGLLGEMARHWGDMAQPGLGPSDGHWQSLMIPLMLGPEMTQIRLTTRQRGRNGAERQRERESGSRFLLDLELTQLGSIQLDGLVKREQKRFDLILRSRHALPGEARRDIDALFCQSLQAFGMVGGIVFQADGKFLATGPLAPLDNGIIFA